MNMNWTHYSKDASINFITEQWDLRGGVGPESAEKNEKNSTLQCT